MRARFESKGGFENAEQWLKKMTNLQSKSALSTVASEGVKSLYEHTPKDTGGTASGWGANITSGRNGLEVSWVNNAYPSLHVNMAVLIEQGHGTRNGGYVPPNPYIKKAMDPVFKSAWDNIAGELFK